MMSIEQRVFARDVITISDAAKRAGKSEAWVRTHRACGPLEPAELCGKQAVTLSSLDQFLHQRRAARLSRMRPKLRLVVNNG